MAYVLSKLDLQDSRDFINYIIESVINIEEDYFEENIKRDIKEFKEILKQYLEYINKTQSTENISIIIFINTIIKRLNDYENILNKNHMRKLNMISYILQRGYFDIDNLFGLDNDFNLVIYNNTPQDIKKYINYTSLKLYDIDDQIKIYCTEYIKLNNKFVKIYFNKDLDKVTSSEIKIIPVIKKDQNIKYDI